MKKQKSIYRLYRYRGTAKQAKRQMPFEWQLTAQLLLDELCFTWNKQRLQDAINHSLDTGNRDRFEQLCVAYRHFVWE
ncbi:hypothetical protein GCM10028778_14020 [Barrientosiimonas marina]|uniref:IDEAL domain-containing protein n=1 Tax=Lentibacillus kimchii TaxID=1542911 RepID=A0ABW2UQX6_9BACI